MNTARTLDQQQADLSARLQRIKEKVRKRDARAKIIVGAMMIAALREGLLGPIKGIVELLDTDDQAIARARFPGLLEVLEGSKVKAVLPPTPAAAAPMPSAPALKNSSDLPA